MASRTIYDLIFNGFENIDIKKMLVILDETYDAQITLHQQMKKYINSRWYDRYKYEYNQSPKNKLIAFYSDLYYRKDHLKIFTDFIKEFPQFDYVIPIRLAKDRKNFSRGIKMTKWDFSNWRKIKNVKMPFKHKLYLIRVLGLIRLYYPQMKRYLDAKFYSYGLVYNDSNPYENVLVQIMRQKGMYTATMQHGLFDKHGYWKGLEFRTSVADDWLAWNSHTKELAMECGIPEKKIKVLGIPRYIHPVKSAEKNKNKTFCVVLGSKKASQENKKMIQFANTLAKNQGMQYFLRCHPTCKEREFYALINEQCQKKDGTEESINQMCEQSDFCLIGSGTSMVIDLIYLKQPFLQYYQEWDGNEYKGRKNYFRNEEELLKQIKQKAMFLDEKSFNYYCTTSKVKESYSQYFNTLL